VFLAITNDLEQAYLTSITYGPGIWMGDCGGERGRFMLDYIANAGELTEYFGVKKR
jgi:hypothetical protein